MSELLEMQQLDKIRAICQVAEQDMSKLSEVRLPSTHRSTKLEFPFFVSSILWV